MQVFIVQNEVESGWMRPALSGETLDEFIKETVGDREAWDSLTYGRGWADSEAFDGRDTLDGLTAVYDPQPIEEGDMESANIKYLEGKNDDDLIIMWHRAEVPDDTKFIWYGEAHVDLDGWCGMGGNGYIEMVEEKE